MKLNPIQILDLQDLAKIEAGKLDKRIANMNKLHKL